MSVVIEGGGNFRDTPTRGEGEGRYEASLGEWNIGVRRHGPGSEPSGFLCLSARINRAKHITVRMRRMKANCASTSWLLGHLD